MHFFTKLFCISFLFSCGLHGMDMDEDEDIAKKTTIKESLVMRLNDSSWEQRKSIITELITHYDMHPDNIRYSHIFTMKFPLYDAITQKDANFVAFLVDRRANVNSRVSGSSHNNDPLLFSVHSPHIAELLLRNKADINAKGDTLPLLCSSSVQFSESDPALILLYGKYGVDACAVEPDGESPLYGLINRDFDETRLEKAKNLVSIGVSLDVQSKDLTWGTMTFVQQLKVQIRKQQNSESSTWSFRRDEIQENIELLSVVQRAVEDRNKQVFAALNQLGRLSRKPANIVIAYFVDKETFKYDDEEINKRALEVAAKQEENGNRRSILEGFDW